MMISPAPQWLLQFQKGFLDEIMTPLANVENRLESKDNGFDWGKAQYNRQFWLRIFTSLHARYLLLCHCMSHWNFNLLVLKILSRSSETGSSLDDIAKFLAEPLKEELNSGFTESDARLYTSALEIDSALIALEKGLVSGNDSASQSSSQKSALQSDDEFQGLFLEAAYSWKMISEDWNLFDIALDLRWNSNRSPRALAKLEQPRTVLYAVRAGKLHGIVLNEVQVRFFELLKGHNLSEAIEELAVALGSDAILPENLIEEVQRALILGNQFSLWKERPGAQEAGVMPFSP